MTSNGTDTSTAKLPSATLIIHPKFKQRPSPKSRREEIRVQEIQGLAEAISLDVKEVISVNISKVIPATFIGSGKAEEIGRRCKEENIKLVIFDDSLSPIQQRNLEKKLRCKVIDRTALILEIFGERAQTKEGKLQVELASLEYQKSRLVRSWTHLERQRGGLGFVGGPGEKQIEADKRQIQQRIKQIKLDLDKVRKTRELHRKSRSSVPYPVIALVGYTNAGKSTLFNQLTGANIKAEDQLFATLDPTMRMIKLPSGKKAILSDTVGFISELPTMLVAAFRATLEEVIEADLILHVRDISSEDTAEQKHDVLEVLSDIVSQDKLENNMIEILNKIDLTPNVQKTKNTISISALNGDGIDDLMSKIDNFFMKKEKNYHFLLTPKQSTALAWLYKYAHNVNSKAEEKDIYVRAYLSNKQMEYFSREFPKIIPCNSLQECKESII